MTTQPLLSLPVVQTLSPVEIFALLKRMAAAEQLKQRITGRTGLPALCCFADLVKFDARLMQAQQRWQIELLGISTNCGVMNLAVAPAHNKSPRPRTSGGLGLRSSSQQTTSTLSKSLA